MSSKSELAALTTTLKRLEVTLRESTQTPEIVRRCQEIRLAAAEDHLRAAVVEWSEVDEEYDERIRYWRREAGAAEAILAGLVTQTTAVAALPPPPPLATASKEEE